MRGKLFKAVGQRNIILYKNFTLAFRKSSRGFGNRRKLAVNRADYVLVQTPQVFDAATLHQAFRQSYSPLFTDDASVVEAAGEKVVIVEGNFENIKITRPVDLVLAEAILLNSKR